MGDTTMLRSVLLISTLVIGAANAAYRLETESSGQISAMPCDTCLLAHWDANSDSAYTGGSSHDVIGSVNLACNGGTSNWTMTRYTDASCTTVSTTFTGNPETGTWNTTGTTGYTYQSGSATFYKIFQFNTGPTCTTTAGAAYANGTNYSNVAGTGLLWLDTCLTGDESGQTIYYKYTTSGNNIVRTRYTDSACTTPNTTVFNCSGGVIGGGVSQTQVEATIGSDCINTCGSGTDGWRSIVNTVGGSTSGSSCLAPSIALAAALALAAQWYCALQSRCGVREMH